MYPNMYINVDLKDAPDSYEGTVAPTKMYEDIINNQAQDRTCNFLQRTKCSL